MRVIRTEYYADWQDLESEFPRNVFSPGVSVCWFSAPELGPKTAFGGDQILVPANDADTFDTRAFITLLLVEPLGNSEYYTFQSTEDAVDAILNLPVVIEQSPPQTVPLTQLLARATATPTIGTLLGYSLAANHPLMLLTVPLGIVVVGSAIGVSEGLQKGLAKRVERFIAGNRKR